MESILDGRRVLVVDDEPDVVAAVVDILSRCAVDSAASYEEARAKLAASRYDVVILDIMGVRGYDLLAEFEGTAPCIMLTAHALTPADLERSRAGNALLYVPKTELPRLEDYVAKVILASALAPKGVPARRGLWAWLLRRLDFRRWFGPGEARAGRP